MITRKKLQGKLKLVYFNALIVVYVEKKNTDPNIPEDDKIELGMDFAKKSIRQYNSNIENHTPHSIELESDFSQANKCIEIDDGLDLLVIDEPVKEVVNS
jgi:hypothetical protein